MTWWASVDPMDPLVNMREQASNQTTIILDQMKSEDLVRRVGELLYFLKKTAGKKNVEKANVLNCLAHF